MVKGKGMFSLEKKRLEWYKVEGREEWHGAGCSLQIFEGLSFGRGIDLLCNVLQDERNMIGNWKEGNFGQHMSKHTHCSHTCYHL